MDNIDLIINIINKIKKFIFEIVFPHYCVNCQKEGAPLCDECLNKIKTRDYFTCPICNKRMIDLSKCQKCKTKTSLNGLLTALNSDDAIIHQLIYAYKYNFVKDLANPLSEILISYFSKSSIYNGFGKLIIEKKLVFMPIPLHKQRLRWRGFNQSEILAEKLSQRLKTILDTTTLRRAHNTNPQTSTDNREERFLNIKNSFEINNKEKRVNLDNIKGKTIILVDDICTTGATLEECAKTLKALKPKHIFGLVLTRG